MLNIHTLSAASMKKLLVLIRFSKLKASLRYQFVFSKTVPFICGLVVSYSFVENSVVSVLMHYLTEIQGKTEEEAELGNAAIVINLQDGLSCILVTLLSVISEVYTGRFAMVTFCASASTMGLMLIWISAINTSSVFEYRMVYLAIFLLAFGRAGQTLLQEFLKYQLDEKVRVKKERKSGRNEENRKNEKEQDIIRTNIWWYPAWYVGYSLTLIISHIYYKGENDSLDDFKIAALFMVGTYLFFFLGCVWYSYEKLSSESNLRMIFRISKAAFKKRKLRYPTSPNGYYWKNYKQNHLTTYKKKHDSQELIRLRPRVPSLFRWLDKAAIVKQQSQNDDSDNHLSPEMQEKKGELCNVKQVREVKSLVPLIYLGFTFFACSLVVASGNTFFVAQTSNLKSVMFGSNGIPFLFVIKDIVSDMSAFICWIIRGLTKSKLVRSLVTTKRKGATITRVGIGMICAIVCCILARQVEVRRLSLIKEARIPPEDSNTTISMTTTALLPQFVLLGVTEGLVEDGLTNLFRGHVAKSMWNLDESFSQSVMGTGKLLTIPCVLIFTNWFKETTNASHLDRYYLMLAILNSVFLFIFVYYCFKYAYKEECPEDEEIVMAEQRLEHDHQQADYLEESNETEDDMSIGAVSVDGNFQVHINNIGGILDEDGRGEKASSHGDI